MKNVSQSIPHTQGHELLLQYENALKNEGIDPNTVTGFVIKKKLWAKAIKLLIEQGHLIARAMNFLTFVCEVTIAKVEEFVVGEYYKAGLNNGIKFYFGNNFENWILKPIKDMKISGEESKLEKHLLKKDAYDSEIQSDFVTKPIIPVKVFMSQLKGLIKAGQLDNSGTSNIFNVDLTEIGDNRVVAVDVYWYGDGWNVIAYELDYVYRWGLGNTFFAPVTA